jgi:DNA-binding CsgD family transcriptional regulator
MGPAQCRVCLFLIIERKQNNMRKGNSELILTTIDGLYEWVNSGAQQNITLDTTGLLLGSSKAILLQLSLVGSNHAVLAETALGPDVAGDLLNSINDNGNFMRHYRGWDQGNVYDSVRLQLADDVAISKFYEHVASPSGLNYSIAGVIMRERNSCIVVCYYRSLQDQPFCDDDLKNLTALLPHWHRAISIKNRLNRLDRQTEATHRILDHAPFSILLVDSAAYVLYQNYMANVGNRSGDGLTVRDGQLRFGNPATRKEFMRLLSSVDQLREEAPAASPVMMAVERPSGSKPYQLMILPVQKATEAGLAIGPTYAIFIYDPTVNLPVDANSLRTLEGLTLAEANLCESLYQTKNLGETANQLEVSISTAKTHLLNTFRKLEINSQSELMKYLAHMPKLSRETRH